MGMRASCSGLLRCAVVSLAIACGDSSGPGAGTPANVILVSGDAQPTSEVGAKLGAPLVVRVTDAKGNNLSGVSVAWSAASGSVSAESSITDASGSAMVEWTLGTAAGSQTATATVTGLKVVTFTATAAPGPITQIILTRDTIELLGVGDTFRLNARAADRFGNVITGQPTTVESADPSVVTADNFGNGALLTARAADKTIDIRATLGSILKTGTVVVLPPPCGAGAASSDLAVGQMILLSGGAASEFCVTGTPNGAEFVAIPFFSDFHGTLLRLSISTGNTTIPAFSNRGIAPSFQTVVGSARAGLTRDEAFERGLRERSINELTPMMPAARLAVQRAEGLRKTIAVPTVGDIFKLNTNSSNACSGANTRTGRVVAITDRAVIVADTANPANGFTTADYLGFGVTFDTLVYPVDTTNFGGPSDVDKNQRVVLFFTRAVNELTPPGVGYYVGGFFFTRDLFPVQATASLGGCATSNFAEMFYLLVPDPAGAINQNPRSVDFVKTVTVSTLAHEFQHLINASRRLYVVSSNSFEDVFLDEGLAHEAEELAFYRASGLSPGQNINYQQIQASPKIQAAFDNFEAPNVRRLIEYLSNPLSNSPYVNNGNITTRGAIWSFLRYAADRKGGNESQMWFQLANPPADVRGIANITRAITDDLSGWVRDWAIANYADDLVPSLQPTFTHPSWNMRSVAEAVNQGFWPLSTQQLDTTSITSVVITDGGAAYLRFGVRPGSIGGGRITARGATVPQGFALSILRTK
jgi:hypothetical protein